MECIVEIRTTWSTRTLRGIIFLTIYYIRRNYRLLLIRYTYIDSVVNNFAIVRVHHWLPNKRTYFVSMFFLNNYFKYSLVGNHILSHFYFRRSIAFFFANFCLHRWNAETNNIILRHDLWSALYVSTIDIRIYNIGIRLRKQRRVLRTHRVLYSKTQ